MTKRIYLAAGCFWCVEAVFLRIKGVKACISGYMGGKLPHPSYEQVCTGHTGHAEAVAVDYDPLKISLAQILEYFWQCHDPTTLNRQGNDVGTQYRSAIFYNDPTEKTVMEGLKKRAQASFSSPIVTTIELAPEFFPAEEYHQNFFAKNPTQGYCVLSIPPKLKKLNLV